MIVKYYYTNIFNINTSSLHFRTLGVISVYLISLLMVMLLKKIPLVRKVLP